MWMDEGLCGYLTKFSRYRYPIGSISKMDLRTFLKWAAIHLGTHSRQRLNVWKVVEDFLLWTCDLSVSMFKVCPLILICVTNGHKVDACRGG
ncbi:hypothetical protein R3W88_017815 [Solanum pinnatisectum]|uniref:Uncharacterized protein n=1 Tax=Solanum pinnatisectum TaxID=50273 RepID=A0AAV9L2D5_9SOLN|nr:hypothetical protein R3W88_017815 [Solanum pinnatisectum]